MADHCNHMMEDKRDLSLRLYNVLDHVGASEELRTLHRDTAITIEIIHAVSFSARSGVLNSYYSCGSSYEGTLTPDLASDRDIIHCSSFNEVVPDIRSALVGLSYLIVIDKWTYPGHVKLQCVRNGCPLVDGHATMHGTDFDWTGRMCLKHFTGVNKHGPASMALDENGMHYLDHVGAKKCQRIPPFALNWFLRQRPYNRPSQEHLHEMSKLGCMFVGAGCVYSGEKKVEWKFSFTLQERQLMSELSPVQHKVYVMLKIIKKNVLGEYFNAETLTSYHCKTCIMFAVQMTPAGAWTEENLINCLQQCLKLLIKWIEQGNCPNYFIKDQNLFMKEGFLRTRGRLLSRMRFILESDTNMLYMIKSDNIADLLRNGDVRRCREITTIKRNEYAFKLKILIASNIRYSSMHAIQGLSRGYYDHFSLARAMGALKRMKTINGHSAEVVQSSLAYLYPFFHLHIANALVSMAYRYPDKTDPQSLVETADLHYSEARGLDLVNERLARATVLYKSEHYDKCFHLLREIKNDFVNQVYLLCPCTSKCSVTYNDIQDKHNHESIIANISMEELIQSLTACCVVFLPSESEITPVPLQYEMKRSMCTLPGSRFDIWYFWFDWAVVDPRIYMYLMQYLVTCKMHKEAYRQAAMDNIRAEIDKDNMDLGHKETAYNLLGWIHMQEGHFAEAYACFVKSWKKRPHHNAAKLHVCCLVAKLMNKEGTE